MICKIDTSTEEGKKALKDLRVMVAGELNDMASQADKPKFVLEDYVKSIYDFVKENTEGDKATKHAMALSYAGLAVDAINKIQSIDETIGDYLFDQKVSLDKIRELSMLYKKATLESFADLASRLGIVETTAEDLEEESKASQTADRDTKSTTSLGTTETDPKDLPDPDLKDINYKKPGVFTAAKPTANADQDQELLQWLYPGHPDHGKVDPTKVFAFKVKRFLLGKVFAPGMNMDSSNIFIPYSGKKGIYLTLRPIQSLPVDQTARDAAGPAMKDNDLVLVVTDADGVPVRFGEDGSFNKDGNISYHYYRKIYSDQVDSNGRVSLYKRKPTSAEGLIDDYDRAKALRRRNSALTEEQAQEAIRQELQMIYDINQAYKKNPTLKLRSVITGSSSFGLLQTDSKLYTPISEISFEAGEFAPKIATMDNALTGEKKGYAYFETTTTGSRKIEVVRFPVKKVQSLQDTLISLMIDELPFVSKFGTSRRITQSERERFVKNYLYLSSTGIQIFGNDTKDGVLKVKIRGKEIYRSLPTKQFNKETGLWEEADIEYTPEALAKNKEDIENARKALNEYFNTLGPQAKLDEKELSLEEKQKIIEGTDPLDPETIAKFKDFSIFRNTETGELWRITYPPVALNQEKLSSNTYSDVNLETVNDKPSFVEKEKSYVNFIKENAYVHHPLNAENKLTAFNAYYAFDYLPEDLEKVFKKPEVDKKSDLPQSTPTSKGPADNNNLKGIKSILDDPDFNKVMDQKNIDVKATEEQLKAVLPWWESSPLSKTGIKLEVLFDMVNTKNPKAIANMSLHALTLYKGADYSDLYHEAWHYFTQAFMTQEQRDSLYAEAGKMKGSFTDYKGKTVMFKDANPKQIEEYLAEDFRAYMLSGGKKAITNSPVKKSLFQKILDFLQALFGDESFSVIDADNNSIRSIYEVYEKLRIGNLNEYNFSTKNYQWSSLDKGITALSEAESVYNLSYEDSKYVVDTIDSLLSKFVDDFSEVKRNQGLESYKWTKTLLQNAKGLKAGYQQVLMDLSYIRNGIQSKINDLDSQIANLSPEEATPYQLQKSKLVNKINLLDWTIKNFGDTDNLMNNRPGKNEAPKGVIAYHQQKSKITTQEAKEAFFAEDVMKEEDMFLLGREGFDRKGNENSVKDMASEEILFILHGLHKTDRGGNLIYEENTEVEIEENGVKRTIGIPQLQDFDVTWNVLVKKLQNTLSAEVMVEKLVDLAEKRQDLPIGQLMKKMGPLNTKGKDEFNIWTNFFQTFNKTNIPLLQTTVELKTVDANGKSLAFENYEYNIRAVAATGDVNAIKAFWNSNFQTLSKPTKFIKKTPWGVNYLDTKAVMEAYPDGTSLKNKAVQFLNDIGIQLDDNEDINNPLVLEQLIKPINSLYLVIKELSENKHYKYTVTKPSILADQITKLDDKGEPIIEINPKTKKEKELKFAGENKNLNAIADIQAKYSEKWGNFQRTNAEGNTQFEHSLNNSLTVMINALNDAVSYEELISAPWMKRLDVRKNPNAKASLWLRSMFDMDDFYNGGPGRKRLDPSTKSGLVELQIKNLSGVAYSENGNFDTDKGTASSSADSTTKFLMDFHMTLVNGATELMRHADKGTSYGVFLSTVLKPDLTDKKGYVNTVNFLKKEGEFTRAELEMYNLSVLPSLNAELTRIQDFRNKQEQIDRAKKEGKPSPVENFDFTYLKKGQGFVVFQGVLQASTKVRLIKEVKGDMLEYFNTPQGAELKELVLKDLSSYFKNETQKVADMFRKITKKSKRKSLISNNVIEEFRIKMSKDSDLRNVAFDPAYEGQIKLALIKTYVFSNWVHNIESINLIYGDLAQYNMAKEEFHKRNAGVTSTGDIYRTDQAAIDYVNNVLGRGYLKQQGIDDNYGPFTGRLNTAVVQDNEIRSSYFKEYAEAIIEDMVSRNVDRKEAERKVLGFDDKTGKTGTIENPIKGGKLWAYQNMNEGDAQGWITIDTYRILINLEGKWSDKQEALYQKIIKGEPVGEKDIFETFPPQKLQYWGPLDTEGMPITAFHKFSLMPLVPSIIKNTNLKNLHDKMVREGIDYAVFNSGSKVGTITKDGKFDKLYADDNRTISNEPFTKNVIFLNYLKNQLNIAPKYKNKVTFSTQLRKLIEGGLIENGVPTDYKGTKEQWDAITSESVRKKESKNYSLYKRYEDNLKELTELKKEELLEEMDWKMVDGQPQGNIENLVKFVRAELTRQDLAEHEIDFIDVVEGGKKLKHDLSMSSSASKIEKVLNSIVTNRLIKQKINGEGLIQVSGAAFESLESVLAPRKATKEEIKKWGTNDLPTYHKGENGKTVAMKVKVAMQGKFKNLLKSKDVLDRAKEKSITPLQALNELVREDAWLNKGENRKMITMVGVRIPVQGINSAEFMEVYEFLPEEAGNIIIPPAEIVAKSGSDFDIDKLTVIMPNIAQYGENVKLVKFNKANVKIKKQLQEELQDLYAMRTSTREMYDEWFTEDKEAGVFKTLTEEEKAIIEKLKEEFASKLKEINDKLNPLKDAWNKLSREQGRSFYTSNEFVETENQILNLTAEKEALYKDFDNNKDFYKSTFYNEKVRPLREKEQQDIDNINKQIAEVKEKIDSASTKGLENDLLNDIKEMLELPENYVTLITPNGTDVAEPLADELGPLVNDYNSKNIFTGKGTEKEDEFLREESPKSIQGTRVLEVGYNLSKHANNNVGKAVLGIGAVDNTMNSILNRVGAYLKPEATVWYSNNKKSVKVRQKILMDHNTMTLPDGSKAISLSHLYDAENKNSIGDLISQLMNGWVDVAKNAWVFNIQGNKEITPTLLFMIQAGVPFETAVYMVSQPIIREYVEEQRAGMSGFSSIMGLESKSRALTKFDAKKRILQKYYPEYFTISDEVFDKAYNEGGQEKVNMEINKLFSKKTLSTFIENETTEAFSKDNGNIKSNKLWNNIKEFSENPERAISDYEKAVFLHFLELEDMAGAVKDIKMSMNFDTSRDGNIFEAQNRMALIERVRNNDRLPVEIVDKILTQSPISSFYISEFQSKIWEPLFKLRNKQSFNDFILEKMKDPTFFDDVENTFADKETFVNTFRNDLISKIFQDSLKSFNIDNIKSYKGYEVVQGEIPSTLVNKVEDVSSLRIGVFFKDGKVYLDKKTLAEQYINSAYARLDYDNLGLAKLDLDTFPTNGFKEYFHFVFEREYLRGLYGGTVELLDNPEFQAIRTEIQEKTKRIVTDLPTTETRIINDQDLASFKTIVDKSKKLPREWFTNTSSFKEFYNPSTGKREKAPQNSKWVLNKYDLYDLWNTETGELYISNVNLQTGMRIIPTKPSQSFTSTEASAKPKGKEVKDGIYVNEGALTKEEQLELFDYLKPYLEQQAAKSLKSVQGSKMIGLGLRWDYKSNNPGRKSVDVSDLINPLNKNKFGYYNESVNGKPLGQITPRIRQLMEKATGVDMTHYDGAIINLYDNNSFISSHNDVDESKSAINYPVIGINLGGTGNFSIESRDGDPKQLDLKAGTGYVFGVNGVNREVYHRTFAGKQDSFLPALTTAIDGKTYEPGSYRITITMRRVMPLTKDMPQSPFIKSTQPSTIVNNPTEYTNHSGGAKGYDAEWDLIGKEFGMVNNKHYLLPSDGDVSDPRLKAKGVKPVDATSDVGEVALQGPATGEAQIAVTNAERAMGRIDPTHTTRNTKKIRNYAQVKNADGIFAIGSLIPKGADITVARGQATKKALVPQVNGGTSVAVQLGITMGKPTYVFNQVANAAYPQGWYQWNASKQDFVSTNTPVLTKNFAGIGTSSNTTEIGKQAIRDVYANTFKTQPQAAVKPTIDLNREWRGDLESRPVYTAEGVNTMRSSATNAFENFGNPFSEAGYAGTIKVPSIGAAVIAYKEWLLGTNHEDVKPQQRKWILDQINQGKLDGATLLYAGKSESRGQGMHPTALAEVVEQLRSKSTQPSAQPQAPATQEEETDYDITKIKEEESLDSYYRRVNALAFEEFIKEKALTNTYNTKTLFKGNRTYADKLNMIKTKFADENLIERYPVLRVLGVDATVIDKVNRYANVKLVANLNDTEELNSFYEQMLDLQNPTVKKVENPEANKFISEYFANLTMVSMLQSGLNTSSRFSITRLLPQDSYIRLMEKPIKDKIDNLSDLYLEEYYKMFVEQNNISRYKLRDRFKDYTSRYGSAENFRNNIRKQKIEDTKITKTDIVINFDSDVFSFGSKQLQTFERLEGLEPVKGYSIVIQNQPDVDLFAHNMKGKGWEVIDNKTKHALPLSNTEKGYASTKDQIFDLLAQTLNKVTQNKSNIKILENIGFDFSEFSTTVQVQKEFLINTQVSGAKVIDSSVLKKGEDAEKIMLENPDLIFMYKDVVQGKSPTIAGPGDLFFRNQPLSNKFGIPDRNSSYLTVSDLVRDVDGKPNPNIVKLIDDMVEAIEKSGKTPVFSEQGYGQEWIGFTPEDVKSEAVKNAILTKTAPQTFLYLSKVLFEKFGYVNKNYDKTTTGRSVIQSKQPITDEMVSEFMRKCYI